MTIVPEEQDLPHFAINNGKGESAFANANVQRWAGAMPDEVDGVPVPKLEVDWDRELWVNRPPSGRTTPTVLYRPPGCLPFEPTTHSLRAISGRGGVAVYAVAHTQRFAGAGAPKPLGDRAGFMTGPNPDPGGAREIRISVPHPSLEAPSVKATLLVSERWFDEEAAIELARGFLRATRWFADPSGD